MGWSCTTDAARTMDVLSHWCWETEKSQNTFRKGDSRFFWERSSREHADGSVTGQVMRMLPGDRCRPAGSFKIAPDGELVRFPQLPVPFKTMVERFEARRPR